MKHLLPNRQDGRRHNVQVGVFERLETKLVRGNRDTRVGYLLQRGWLNLPTSRRVRAAN